MDRHKVVFVNPHPPERHGEESISVIVQMPLNLAYLAALTPQQSGMRRLAHETPIENLYLTGHWTIPGPGVCAVVASGWRVANRIAAREPAVSRPADGRTGTSALA